DVQLLSQPEDEVEIPLDAGPRVLQPLHVREIAASLGREPEAGRGPVAPSVDRARGREPVEGRVELHGAEDARVVFEPPPGRKPLGVEDVTAVVVDVSAGPDVDHAIKVRTLIAWRTRSWRLPPASFPPGGHSKRCASQPRPALRAPCTRRARRRCSA